MIVGEGFELTRSLSHGHLDDLLGPPCRKRDIAYALILARVVYPRPKLATTKWWADTTLASDFALEGISTDEVYAAMDCGGRQGAIEASLATRRCT